MSLNMITHTVAHLSPDVHGVLMLAGAWSPMLLVVFRAENLALLLSMTVAILAIIDYCLKIWWKLRSAKEKNRQNGPLTDEERAWMDEIRGEEE